MAGKSNSKYTFLWAVPVVLLLGLVVFAAAGLFQARAQLDRAGALKHDLSAVVHYIQTEQPDSAMAALEQADRDIADVRQSLDAPFWRVLSALPVGRTEMKAVHGALDLWDDASRELLKPAIVQLKDQPLSHRKLGDELNDEWLVSYLLFAGESLPKVRLLLEDAQSLDLGLLDRKGEIHGLLGAAACLAELTDRTLSPVVPAAAEQLRTHPLSDLKQEEGFRADVIVSYLDFAEGLTPNLLQLRSGLDDPALEPLEKLEAAAGYLDTGRKLLGLFDENQGMLRFLRVFLGHGEDRNYLVAAMNSAEVRAVGGFPGSIGSIQIKDGLILIGDFTGIKDVMPRPIPRALNITDEEVSMFSCNLTNMGVSWDACLCPDFERVGEIWAVTTGNAKKISIDGVIGVNPTVIQDLLAVAGSITLSDGTELTGENATVILQHDMYFDHFGKNQSIDYHNTLVDKLFSETAKLTMKQVLGHFTATRLPGYAEIVERRFADRSLMVWMQDEADQAVIRELGYSGGLGTDPVRPEAGVYINCIAASKMGWFAEVTPEIGQPVFNADGSRTYPMTVTLNNAITREEIEAANYYITGGLEGALDLSVYLFAPAGGSIQDLEISDGSKFAAGTYKDLEVGYLKFLRIQPDTPVVIRCRITTSPAAQMPLSLSMTPTLQDYHWQVKGAAD